MMKTKCWASKLQNGAPFPESFTGKRYKQDRPAVLRWASDDRAMMKVVRDIVRYDEDVTHKTGLSMKEIVFRARSILNRKDQPR